MQVSLATGETGHYLVAEEGGGGDANANRDRAGLWERVGMCRFADDTVAFATSDGWFLTCDYGANRLRAARRCMDDPGVRFRVVELDGGWVALESDQRTFLSARQGGGSHIEVDRTEVGPWERWKPYDWANGQPPDRRDPSDLEPFTDGWKGMRADMLTLGMKPTDRETVRSSFWWATQTDAERREDYALLAERGYNAIIVAAYVEHDGVGWGGDRDRGPINLLQDPKATQAIEITRQNAEAGLHTIWLLKSDDCPGLDGHRTDPWRARGQMDRWVTPWLDALRPHLTCDVIWPGLELNEWASAKSQADWFEHLHREHPDLWLMSHYTQGRDNGASATGSSYGAQPTWRGKLVTWGGQWYRMLKDTCDGKVGIAFQTGETVEEPFRDQIAGLYDRIMLGHHGWNAPGTPFFLSEMPWRGGEAASREMARWAAAEGIESFWQGAPAR